MTVGDRPHVLALAPEELVEHARRHGMSLRIEAARRILVDAWRHPDRKPSRETVARATRDRVAAIVRDDRLEIVERVEDPSDGFVKYLLCAPDGAEIEAVRIPLHEPGRFTVCLSSQVGCAMRCAFCATGRLGLRRNLAAWEILAAFVAVRDEAPGRVTGAVFQGQGEPLHNYDEVIRAARRLCDPTGAAITGEAITISTVGLVPQIRRYTAEGHPFRLIVSLTTTHAERRRSLLPVASRHTIEDVAAAVRDHQVARGGRVTLAWVLIGGLNGGTDEIDRLRELFAGVPVTLNLIDVNDAREDGFPRAGDEERGRMLDALSAAGIPFTRRYSGGTLPPRGVWHARRHALVFAGILPSVTETSLTEMVAVRPRGPKIFLAVMALAIVGGVVWFFFGRTPGPIGAPEDPAKVLVVGGDAAVADELAALGLDVEHGTFEALEARARTEVDGLEATGPAAILALADQLGAGYVAFADPSTLSFGSIAVTPSSAAVTSEHRWAVLSVGELAQPHPHVTVGRDDRLYPLPPTVELLRALFEQERLAATLVGEEKLAPIARPIFERVQPAIGILGGYGMADVKARKIERARVESLDEPEEAEPEPAIVADPLEITSGFPVANGGIVLFSERPRLDAPRDPDVRLEYDGVAQAFWLPPGKTATSDREPCEAPIATVSPAGTVVTEAGDAMLIRVGERVEVWTMPADAKGCPFVRKGTIPGDAAALGTVDGSGRVLRPVDVDGEQMVEVWAPDESQPQVWPMSGCSQLGTPAWIDDAHFAIACRYDSPQAEPDPYAEAPPATPDAETPVIPEQTWLYVSSTRTGQVLAWRIDVSGVYLPDLHLRRQPKLSLVAEIDSTRLLLVGAGVDVRALFEAPPLDAALPRPAFVPPDEAGIAALAPTAFETSQLDIDPTAGSVVLSPTGTHAAFEIDRDPFDEWSTNVAVLDLASGRTKRVAIDRWAAHEDPRFTADGKTLVFVSAYEADNRTVTALRTVAVP